MCNMLIERQSPHRLILSLSRGDCREGENHEDTKRTMTGRRLSDADRREILRFVILLIATVIAGICWFIFLHAYALAALLFCFGLLGAAVVNHKLGLVGSNGYLISTDAVDDSRRHTDSILGASHVVANDALNDDTRHDSFSCSFQETPTRVRSCDSRISTSTKGPKNGTYDIVYSAVYFGKLVRSQGRADMVFTCGTNGWEIRGQQFFGVQSQHATQKTIVDGFVNSDGYAYWITEDDDMTETSAAKHSGDNRGAEQDSHDVPVKSRQLSTIYRGIFNIERNELFDGDFQAGQGHTGRLVRVQLVVNNKSVASSPRPTKQNTVDLLQRGHHDDSVELVSFAKS